MVVEGGGMWTRMQEGAEDEERKEKKKPGSRLNLVLSC